MNTMDQHEAWLTVALMVARDGLPHPTSLHVRDGGVDLSFDAYDRWGRWVVALHLAAGDPFRSIDGERWIYIATGRGDGVRWYAQCTTSADESSQPDQLAAQVANAIASTDERHQVLAAVGAEQVLRSEGESFYTLTDRGADDPARDVSQADVSHARDLPDQASAAIAHKVCRFCAATITGTGPWTDNAGAWFCEDNKSQAHQPIGPGTPAVTLSASVAIAPNHDRTAVATVHHG